MPWASSGEETPIWWVRPPAATVASIAAATMSSTWNMVDPQTGQRLPERARNPQELQMEPGRPTHPRPRGCRLPGHCKPRGPMPGREHPGRRFGPCRRPGPPTPTPFGASLRRLGTPARRGAPGTTETAGRRGRWHDRPGRGTGEESCQSPRRSHHALRSPGSRRGAFGASRGVWPRPPATSSSTPHRPAA